MADNYSLEFTKDQVKYLRDLVRAANDKKGTTTNDHLLDILEPPAWDEEPTPTPKGDTTLIRVMRFSCYNMDVPDMDKFRKDPEMWQEWKKVWNLVADEVEDYWTFAGYDAESDEPWKEIEDPRRFDP